MNYFKFGLIVALTCFTLLSTNCKGSETNRSKANLSHETAKKRKEIISGLHYILNIDLTDKENLKVKTKILFQLKSIENIHLDFENGNVSDFSINSEKVIPSQEYYENSIPLPANFLKIGENTVNIEYTKSYSRNGTGLHKFIDPEDGSIYFYTQFEAFHANKVFPCFDQPDLKADFQLNLITPKDFSAISSTLPKLTVDSGVNKFNFPVSKIFSTYLFSIIAGPYSEWKSQYKSIPLRLYSRKSMAKFVNSEEWFLITKQGLQFFEEYFAIPYPFGKYDQIIVPEFNSGAMENVGAVTFSERYLSRGVPTRNQRESIANVVLHEMAHFWFGNLVTMEWWNGLWLNESFATYMASLAQFQATEFKESWITFFQKMKIWAYKEDQLSTTHPIESVVPDTNQATANFDGITYGKGASVLKQLAFYVGENNFRDGVRDYLKQNSFKNANLVDFLQPIEKRFGKELKYWSKEWLEKEGLNEIQADFQCSNKKITNFHILQTNSTNSTIFRTHKTKLQLISEFSAGLKVSNEIDVVYKDKSTEIPQLKGMDCPIFVSLNSKDMDYVKFIMDPVSLNNLEKVLENLTEKDLLAKTVIWASYWDMVLDGKVSINTYKDFVLKNIAKENNEKILRFVLPTIHSDSGVSYYTSLFWEDYRKETKELTELQNFYKKNLLLSEKGSDIQKLWFYGYINLSDENSKYNDLLQILEEKKTIEGLKIDQDIRWTILQKLSTGNLPIVKELVKAESEKDKTQRGKDFAIACQASYNSKESKQKFLQKILAPKSEYSNTTLRVIANSLFPINQKNLQSEFTREIYSGLNTIEVYRDDSFIGNYVKSLVPSNCDEKSQNDISDYLIRKNMRPSLRKNLIQLKDHEINCLKLRKKQKSE
ncbi:MAG: aminopeptidase N [Leptospiraceae bacterium]|nr:aminopeptidase N [Leptospiraceae bacterium]MCK6379685.1 aminopeptidase N [Leptospiraceae bacterium]NUM41576.1 aminopeptidase N [Leptospiraceae bacterium]